MPRCLSVVRATGQKGRAGGRDAKEGNTDRDGGQGGEVGYNKDGRGHRGAVLSAETFKAHDFTTIPNAHGYMTTNDEQ